MFASCVEIHNHKAHLGRGQRRRLCPRPHLQGLPWRRAGWEPERESASTSVALYSGGRRRREARRSSQQHCGVTAVHGAVSEAEPALAVTGSSALLLWDWHIRPAAHQFCDYDNISLTRYSDTTKSREGAVHWSLPRHSKEAGQAPQRAHKQCGWLWYIAAFETTWLCFFFPAVQSLCFGMLKSSVASITPRTFALLSKSPSSEGVTFLMKVVFCKSAAGFVGPLTLAIFYQSPFSAGTAVLMEEELDWLQSGVVFPCAPPPQKGRPLVSMRQVKRREGRLLHKFHFHHCPPRSARHSTDTCRFSGVSGLLCSRLPKWSSVRKNNDARPVSPPSWAGRVWRMPPSVTRRQWHTGADPTLHEPAHREEVHEAGGEADQTGGGQDVLCVARRYQCWTSGTGSATRWPGSSTPWMATRPRPPQWRSFQYRHQTPLGQLVGWGFPGNKPWARSWRQRSLRGTREERYIGRQEAFDELDGAGTLKGLLQKEVSLFLVELSPDELCRGIGQDISCPFCPWFRMKNSKGGLYWHVLHYHSAERHFACIGTKQLRAIMYVSVRFVPRQTPGWLSHTVCSSHPILCGWFVVLALVECRWRVQARVVRIPSAFHKQGDQHWSTRRSSCREHVLWQGVRGSFASTLGAVRKENHVISGSFSVLCWASWLRVGPDASRDREDKCAHGLATRVDRQSSVCWWLSSGRDRENRHGAAEVRDNGSSSRGRDRGQQGGW